MIISDLSQIEPRVLAWLAGDWDFLKLVATGESPYVSHSRVSMGFTGEKMDKESDLYRLAKARVLALGYGCGAERFIGMAKTLAGLDITKDDPEWIDVEQPFTGKVSRISGYGSNSKRIVKEFRDQNPKITALWQLLGDAFKRSIGDDFVMTLPNGRVMRYEHVRASIKMEKDPETGKPVRKNVFTADVGGRRTPFYGGRLTENVTQAVARDVFAEHIVALEDRGWTNLYGVHDEVVLEVDPNVGIKDVEEVMSQCPDWLRGCPISAVAKEVTCYGK
jgi:DNA polymerase